MKRFFATTIAAAAMALTLTACDTHAPCDNNPASPRPACSQTH